MRPIVLASASPTRIALLTSAGVPFTARPAPIDERAVEAPLVASGAGPAEVAAALAEAKARAVGGGGPQAIVIGADQTLDLDGRRFVRPATVAQARAQLARLAGREHALHTAVAAVRDGAVTWRYRETARLKMRPLSGAAIDGYLARVGASSFSSVGGYQIEGPGIQLFERIDGDYFAILGLPLLPLLAYLRGEGALE